MNRSLLHPFVFAALLICLLLPSFTRGAETVHIVLTMEGTVIEGESSQTTLGRANTLECYSFESEFFRPAGADNAVHRPVKVVKRIDKATPLLARSLDERQTGNAIIRFYRPNQSTGLTEQFFTVTLEGVQITSHRILSPNALTTGAVGSPALEEVTFTYTSIKLTYTNGNIETEIRVR